MLSAGPSDASSARAGGRRTPSFRTLRPVCLPGFARAVALAFVLVPGVAGASLAPGLDPPPPSCNGIPVLEGDPAFPQGETPTGGLQDVRVVPPGGSCSEGVDAATGEPLVIIRRADGRVWVELRALSLTVHYRDVSGGITASISSPRRVDVDLGGGVSGTDDAGQEPLPAQAEGSLPSPKPAPAILRAGDRQVTVPGRRGDAGPRKTCPRHAPRVRVAPGRSLTLVVPGPVAYAVVREVPGPGPARRVLTPRRELRWTVQAVGRGPRTTVVRVWDGPETFASYALCLVPRTAPTG